MFALFQRRKESPSPSTPLPTAPTAKGWTRPEPAAILLGTPRRQKLLELIWQRTALSRPQFARLYRAPLERYAELVQQFPASESHHHAYPGGMLDHGLEVVGYALKLRQSRLLPIGAAPETQAAQAEAWTAAAAYGALLHDLGKIAVDLQVEYVDGRVWHPWHGPLAHPYRFRYRKDREYRLHSAATGLLYHRLLDRDILDWLSEFPELWAALLYVLAGQYEHAGVLGELVTRADQASVAQELGGDPAKALAAPKHALQRKLLDGLRYLLKEEFKLNQPQASDGWLTLDALWLVSKTVSDKLRAYLLSQGIEGIPENNVTLFNVLQDHGIVQAAADGKAIWHATVTGDNGWSHRFTLLKLAPAQIWEAHERPEPFRGSVRVEDEPTGANEPPPSPESSPDPTNATDRVSASREPSAAPASGPADAVDALLGLLDARPSGSAPKPASNTSPAATPDVHQAENECAPTDVPDSLVTVVDWEPSGRHFLDWLRHGIQTRRLIINDAKALVHTVGNTVFLVSPGVFQRYAQEHPQVQALAKQTQLPEWRWVQRDFERLQVHRKQPDGLNIWTCEVTGPRKSRRLHGYLLTTHETLFSELSPNNPHLKLAGETANNRNS